jgi:UDP-N-acetylglucosamine 4,6-dehydratase/5-epimerase
MTRFNISLQEGVDLVLYALEHMWGGEIFVPKIPSYRITDVAEAIAPHCERDVIGIRPGEKLHEEMITETDALNTLEFDDYFVIMPSTPLWDAGEYAAAFGGKRCEPGFRYNSGTNTEWLSVEDLRRLIREHVDPDLRGLADDPIRPTVDLRRRHRGRRRGAALRLHHAGTGHRALRAHRRRVLRR